MRYLVKIGSALIADNHKINYDWLTEKILEMKKIIKSGDQIILVSSGAVASGMEIHSLKKRPKDITKLQLLSGQGQVELIKFYKDEFSKANIFVGQVLLTHHNFANKKEEENISSILNSFLDEGVVPIVNENDMINKEELDYTRTFTDNDILAALVAKCAKVDKVILLTDVDGLYPVDPKRAGTEIEIIKEVKDIDENIFSMASKDTNSFGLGGMYSKVTAAKMLKEANIETVVANGKYSIQDIISNRVDCTVFKI